MLTWQQDSLQQAKKNKKDEFYTQLVDIENELQHYTSVFKNKIVYLNCDNPRTSNFYRYFVDNFTKLQLRKVIATYHISPENLEQNKDNQLRVTEYSIQNTGESPSETSYPLSGDGDFRSTECIEILQKSDIVVTNPPFSLFREFIKQLVKYNKKFIILGNMTASTSKDIFPLFANNKVWYGKSIHSGDREFSVPDNYPLSASGVRIDENGVKYIRVKGVRWFTNIDYNDRHKYIPLTESYNPESYPKYVNFDAINVPKTALIPNDYEGAMGVPVSFLDKYSPDQFEIIGSSRTLALPMIEFAPKDTFPPGGPRFYLRNSDGTYKRLFERIVIKNKYPRPAKREDN